MASTNIIELAKNHCRLYKGGDKNPYDPTKATENEWAEEYLKFHIWEAEYSVIQKFTWWRDMWLDSGGNPDLPKEEKAEEIYKLAIRDKLRKMDRPDVDFMAMYFNL